MNSRMFWAYLHDNGKVIVKPWFGDHKDYTDDCIGNSFVRVVVEPFQSEDFDSAIDYAKQQIINKLNELKGDY
jgi:hypothetical protein